MKAAIYQTKDGYEIVNCDSHLYKATPSGGKFMVKDCGTINPAVWQPSGALVRGLPNHLKSIFFSLNKK